MYIWHISCHLVYLLGLYSSNMRKYTTLLLCDMGLRSSLALSATTASWLALLDDYLPMQLVIAIWLMDKHTHTCNDNDKDGTPQFSQVNSIRNGAIKPKHFNDLFLSLVRDAVNQINSDKLRSHLLLLLSVFGGLQTTLRCIPPPTVQECVSPYHPITTCGIIPLCLRCF